MLIHMMVFWGFGAPRFAALNDWEFASVSIAAATVSIGLSIGTHLLVEQRWVISRA